MRISVILPVLNEASRIGRAVQSIRAQPTPWEIIVVDGGSSDGTLNLLADLSEARIIHGEKGRARQMNAGAAEASGEILLFLHADCQLPPEAFALIREAFAEKRLQAGSFGVRFEPSSFLLRISSWLSRRNVPWFTFGDQGYVMRREFFEQLGGYKDWPLLEDVDFQERARQQTHWHKLRGSVTTSSRRFRKRGFIPQQVSNSWIMLRYKLGVSPERLKRGYKDVR